MIIGPIALQQEDTPTAKAKVTFRDPEDGKFYATEIDIAELNILGPTRDDMVPGKETKAEQILAVVERILDGDDLYRASDAIEAHVVVWEVRRLLGALEKYILSDMDDGDGGYIDAVIGGTKRVADYIQDSAEILKIIKAESDPDRAEKIDDILGYLPDRKG